MIGPVPESWGGPSRGGGVTSYVEGLATAVANLGVPLTLLADNTDAAPCPLAGQPPAGVDLYPMYRIAGRAAPRAMFRLGPARLARLAARLAAYTAVPIPWAQRLRYLDQAANHDRFLRQVRPQVLHVMHAEFRQLLSQQIAGTEAPVVASLLSATTLLRPGPAWLVQMVHENYRRADRLVACSSFVLTVVAAHVPEPARLTVIPNGVDVTRFRPGDRTRARSALGLEPDAFVVLFTGALVKPKGVHDLLQAFARAWPTGDGARLVLAGSGPEAATLQEQAAALGIAPAVTLAGFRPADELPTWYQACDVFALPSQSEGLSISLLEAMASARPVITTPPDRGSHDAVQEHVNGLLCPFGDVPALAAALQALATAPGLARQMGAAGRQIAERRFDWPIVAAQFVEVYRSVVGEKGSALRHDAR